MKQKRLTSMIVVFAVVCTLILNSVPGEAVAASRPKLNKENVTMAVGTKYTLKIQNLPKKATINIIQCGFDAEQMGKAIEIVLLEKSY